MHDHSQMEDLLSMLESATIESERILNEDSSKSQTKNVTKIGVLLDKLGTYEDRALDARISKIIQNVSSINVTPDFGKITTYSKIDKFQDNYSLNITSLFNDVHAMVRESIKHPESDFSVEDSISFALEHAAHQCMDNISDDKTPKNLSDFKELYNDAVIGEKTSYKFLHLIKHPVMVNLNKCILVIKIIDNKLIYQHINTLRKTEKSLIKEFNNPKFKSDKYKSLVPKYLSAISQAIDMTRSIYSMMRLAYTQYSNECIRILKLIIDNDSNDTLDESVIASSLNCVSSHINEFVRSLRNYSNDSNTALSESAENALKLPSLLNTFSNKSVAILSEDVKYTNDLANSIGPLLNSIDISNFDNSNHTIKTFTNINIPLELDKYYALLDSNYVYLSELFQHYNKNSVSRKEYIMKVLPEELHICIPDNGTNFIGILNINISNKICGSLQYVNPNVNAISQNMLTVMDFLKKLQEHITSINELIFKNINTIQEYNTNTRIMAVNNIINIYFTYLAIILSIYKNFIIFEKASEDVVTAISKSQTGIDM